MSDVPEIVAVHGKAIVARMPNRRFPGIWLPADTLYTWLEALEEMEAADSTGEASFLAEDLRLILGSYCDDLLERGERLPFTWP